MSRAPFSNGTEGEEWMARWCDCCVHDHEVHKGGGPGCEIMMFAYLPDELPWPECWIASPEYWRHIPARIACLKFEACEECGGDPGASERGDYIKSVFVELGAASVARTEAE